MRCVVLFANESELVFAIGLAVLIASGFASSARAWSICMVSLCLLAISALPWLSDRVNIVIGGAGLLTLVIIAILARLPRSSREEDEQALIRRKI